MKIGVQSVTKQNMLNVQRGLVLGGMLAALLVLVPLPALAIGLGTAGQFNTFVFHDFVGNFSDTEGRLAVGGNATITDYDIGLKLGNDTQDALIVGQNLNFTRGAVHGNAVVGGQATLTQTNVTGNLSQHQSTLPVDFAAEKTYLTNLAQDLTHITPTGLAETRWNGLHIVGDGHSKQQVFNVSGSDLLDVTWFDVENLAADATVVFNVSGAVSGFKNMGMWDLQGLESKVLFNFYEATDVSISGVAVLGSILAPNAKITGTNGVIWGTTIADSWQGMTQQNSVTAQQNFKPFEGELPGHLTPVPEPTTVLLFGLGLLGLVGAARKKLSR